MNRRNLSLLIASLGLAQNSFTTESVQLAPQVFVSAAKPVKPKNKPAALTDRNLL